jgi:copper chaperone NosL
MSAKARSLTLIAAALLLAVYALPLWRISLVAPQYPEGLGMQITVNSVNGLKEHDLQNINELNHYIGMKVIDPASIPVLRVMPWVVAALVVFGLAAAAVGRRGVLYAWMATFIGFGGAGMGVFWWWEYDYGHHLDFQHAIIKIPGMTYQPPLIGARQLLNFRAVSIPDWGAWVVGAAFLLGVAAIVVARRSGAVAPAAAPTGG